MEVQTNNISKPTQLFSLEKSFLLIIHENVLKITHFAICLKIESNDMLIFRIWLVDIVELWTEKDQKDKK